MQVYEEEIHVKGRPAKVPAVRVEGRAVIIQGDFLKVARLKDEWLDAVENPEAMIRALRSCELGIDIFTFWQRPPDNKPKYDYYLEWDSMSILPIESFEHWWEKQIARDVRKNIKKAAKKGVQVKVVEFDDELVRGICEIYNETPVRRGKPFWHYGKDFETLKKELPVYLDKSDFIGAYYNDELIGFIKLRYAGRFATPVAWISKLEFRRKCPNNALLAKAVQICAEKGIPCLTYDRWRKGDHAVFLSRHGFKKMFFPRYYIPLTFKGKVVLKLRLHRGVKEIVPEKIKDRLLELRAKWYNRKYARSKMKARAV